MYIEELWKEKPDIVIRAIKKIWNIRDERGDSLTFVGIKNGILQFNKYGHHSYSILIKDFEVYDCTPNSETNIEWLRFMKKVFGAKYIQDYIKYRNQKLNKFIDEYAADYNNDTAEILAQLGVKNYHDVQGITK